MRRATLFLLVAFAVACGAQRTDSADVAPGEVRALVEQGALLLDVRTPAEYASGHVPGAMNLPYDELTTRIQEIDARHGDLVVVYCEKGPRASKAIATLVGAGFSSVRPLAGHMSAWRSSGASIEH
jgi:rhodanese-related sulfurtransferase